MWSWKLAFSATSKFFNFSALLGQSGKPSGIDGQIISARIVRTLENRDSEPFMETGRTSCAEGGSWALV